MTAPERIHQTNRFLTLAEDLLGVGNTMAGAEMLYGALTQVIIAVAVRRDWPYMDHRQRRQVIRDLAMVSNDPDIVDAFGDAQRLHVHFYLNNLRGDPLVAAIGTTRGLGNRLLPMAA